ncbi:MAG: hypothetical protein GY771_08940 [bacterium]|nr:hypothetical protein [bacterium]
MREKIQGGEFYQVSRDIAHERDILAEHIREDIENRLSAFAEGTGLLVKTITIRIHEETEGIRSSGPSGRCVDTYVELYL